MDQLSLSAPKTVRRTTFAVVVALLAVALVAGFVAGGVMMSAIRSDLIDSQQTIDFLNDKVTALRDERRLDTELQSAVTGLESADDDLFSELNRRIGCLNANWSEYVDSENEDRGGTFSNC